MLKRIFVNPSSWKDRLEAVPPVRVEMDGKLFNYWDVKVLGPSRTCYSGHKPEMICNIPTHLWIETEAEIEVSETPPLEKLELYTQEVIEYK